MLQIKYTHNDVHNFPVYAMTYKEKGIAFTGYIAWNSPSECRIFSDNETRFTLIVNGVEYYISNLTLSLVQGYWQKDYPLTIYPRGNWGADYSSGPTESARRKISLMTDLLCFHLNRGTFLMQQLAAYDDNLEYHKKMVWDEIEALEKKKETMRATYDTLCNTQAEFLAENRDFVVFYEDVKFPVIKEEINLC